MPDPLLESARSVDQRNYLYSSRKAQIARLALDGDWAAIRRILDYIDPQTTEEN